MSSHPSPAIERHCDVVVIGGSAAGLTAALQLGRQRRSVIVVDDGRPRNAPAAHMHGYLGHEGVSPSQLLAIGREEVRSYGGEIISGRAGRVERAGERRFRVELDAGHTVVARRVLVAIGLVDRLPAIDGLAPHWGGDVIHCPFCHGFEVRDRRVVQVVTDQAALHTVALFRHLTARLTVVLDLAGAPDEAELDTLRSAGVDVVASAVSRVVDDPQGGVAAVELADGRRIDADAVVVGPRFGVRAEPFAALGLHPVEHPSGLGEHLATEPTGQTSVAGVYAAGNVTDPSQQVLVAAADGGRVGAMIGFDLAEEDLRSPGGTSANQADWDRRYGSERLWSGNPNGSLVAEVRDLPPGRSLDVGAGEGGDVIWLAERGWVALASDISQQALDRVGAAAEQRGLGVSCLRADANAADAFDAGAFDLVSAMYASIPRTPDGRGVANLLRAVAPGGTLLVVGHDPEPMRKTVHDGEPARPFDPDAYVGVDDVAAALNASPAWEVLVHEKRPRPPGAASASHHVDDIVLRARKLPTG